MVAEVEPAGGGRTEFHQVPGGLRGSNRLTSPAAPRGSGVPGVCLGGRAVCTGVARCGAGAGLRGA